MMKQLKQIAEDLGVPYYVAYRLYREGKITPVRRIGNALWFDDNAVDGIKIERRPYAGREGWLTCAQLARKLGISRQRLRQLLKQGALPPPIVIGRRKYWRDE